RLASAPDVETFLGETIDLLLWATGFDRGVAVVRSLQGLWQQKVTRGPVSTGPRSWSVAVVAEAIKRRSALLVDHLPSDARFNLRDSVIRSGVNHVLCVPMITAKERFGALY